MTIKPEEVEEVLGDYDANKPEEINAEDQYKKQQDPDWIEEGEGKYEFELFMSTDGKHTVNVRATTPEGKRKALEVATETYDYLLARYGTKQAQAVKEYGNGKQEEKVDQETCKHINVKFAQSKTEKNPGRWFKGCKDCGKFLSWQ